EFIDPAVHELHDQMLYLTKKARKNGLKPPAQPESGRCLINEALQDLDLAALQHHLQENKKADSLTIFHAMKACLRAGDLRFLRELAHAGIHIPIEKSSFTFFFDRDPVKAIRILASKLSAKNGILNFTGYCHQILRNQKTKMGS